MIILDSNVLSELMRNAPHPNVRAWADQIDESSVWTTSINVFEVKFGIEKLAVGRKREFLLEQFTGLLNDLGQRIANFDTAAANSAAELLVTREKAGVVKELRDTLIAGIVLSNHATLATRNVRHFSDLSVPVVNPWD